MLAINPQKTTQKLVTFLKDAFAKARFTKAVIGLSGGVDSATSCALAVKALGKENVYPVLLPYGELNTQGKNDAVLVCDAYTIPVANRIMYDIQPMVDAYVSTQSDIDAIRTGNVMARSRMLVLFDLAKKYQALVVGTENKSEHLLGYYTRFGDEASDIEPLRSLYKTQVYAVATYLGVPEMILTKAPTAGLWEGQTDEAEFGFGYHEADEILSVVFDQKKTIEEVVATGFSQSVVAKVLARVEANAFKHQLPVWYPDTIKA